MLFECLSGLLFITHCFSRRVIHFKFNLKGFISELVKFSIKKIPASFQSLTAIPIAYSIAQILNRSFSYLYYVSTKTALASNVKYVVNSLVNELFAQSSLPQVKCLIENMSEIFYKSSSLERAASGSENSQVGCIAYLAVFLANYHKILTDENLNASSSANRNASGFVAASPDEQSSVFDKSDILKIYSIFKISSRIFGKF